MAERLTHDISADLRRLASTYDAMEVSEEDEAALLREAADKLDELLDCLVNAENARDRARKVADERGEELRHLRDQLARVEPAKVAAWIAERDQAQREADTWWKRSEKQVDTIADLRHALDRAQALLRDADAWITRVGQAIEAVIIMAENKTPGLAILADLAMWNDRRKALAADAPAGPPYTAHDQCLNCAKPIYLATVPGGAKKWTHDATGRWITGCVPVIPDHVSHAADASAASEPEVKP